MNIIGRDPRDPCIVGEVMTVKKVSYKKKGIEGVITWYTQVYEETLRESHVIDIQTARNYKIFVNGKQYVPKKEVKLKLNK